MKLMEETTARLGVSNDIKETPSTAGGMVVIWKYSAKNIEVTFYWTTEEVKCYHSEDQITKPTPPQYPNEPDGFRGLKWGTNIKTLKGYQLIKKSGHEKWYRCKNDNLTLGGAQLKHIFYVFHYDVLTNIITTAAGHDNAKALEAATINRFGSGEQESSYSDKRLWDGDVTRIMLLKDDIAQEATLMMASKIHLLKRWAEEERAAKEGAARGF